MHVEMIKRANDPLRFLAQRGALRATHLRAIWDASVGKQETVTVAIYKLLEELMPSLTAGQLRLLLRRISRVDGASYDIPLLALVRQLSVHTMSPASVAGLPAESDSVSALLRAAEHCEWEIQALLLLFFVLQIFLSSFFFLIIFSCR